MSLTVEITMWLTNPMASRFAPILLLLPFAIACGSAATPLPVAPSTTGPTAAPTAVTVLSGSTGGSGTMPVYEGIVSWWPGEGNADDIVGGNHGALKNGATFAPGIVGQAFSFPTTSTTGVDVFEVARIRQLFPPDPRVEISRDASLKLMGPLTVAAWVLLDTGASIDGTCQDPVPVPYWTIATTWWVVIKMTPTTRALATSNFTIDINNGCPNFTVTSRFGVNFSAASLDKITTGAWHRLVGVYDTSAAMMYVDGALKNTKTADGELWTRNTTLCIGGTERCQASPFRGLIDEVQIFNRALTEDEIKAIYDAGATGQGKP